MSIDRPADVVAREAERMKRLMDDPAVIAAKDRLEARYFLEFKSATTPAEREIAWAKSRALDDLLTEFTSVTEAGIRVAHDEERRQRRAAQ